MQRIRSTTRLETENSNSGPLHEQIPFGLEAQMFILMGDHTNIVLSNNEPPTPKLPPLNLQQQHSARVRAAAEGTSTIAFHKY